MPDARRLLARMSPGAQSLEPSGGRGKDALTQMDISLAAAHVGNPLAYRWIVYRYGGHETSATVQKLETGIVDELSKWAVEGKWRIRGGGLGPGRLSSLAQLWIAEASRPRQCPQCRGSGVDFDTEAKRHAPCPRCNATGKVPWSGLQRAQWMNICHSAWRQTWQSRYERLSRMMTALEAQAIATVNRQLSD